MSPKVRLSLFLPERLGGEKIFSLPVSTSEPAGMGVGLL